ncbi:MAG: hypothetical protein HY854_24650 [Burkholderiales bacterium]|nr:hypothetical protein [Burkholderiales bacterium]
MGASIRLADLVDAFDWASAVGPWENLVYISRESGQVWLVSDMDDSGDEPPEDADDGSKYLVLPGKQELDLGRSLALRFAEGRLAEDAGLVKGFFARPGAYAKFKDLLARRGALDEWFAYEAQGVEHALRAWAADNDIEVIDDAG